MFYFKRSINHSQWRTNINWMTEITNHLKYVKMQQIWQKIDEVQTTLQMVKKKNMKNANYIANYTKGLRHHNNGEVIKEEYEKLLKALKTGKQEDFNQITQSSNAVQLTNPQAGFAFDLEGPDSHDMGIRKAPRIDGAEVAGEMAELYWMVLCRDIPFKEFDSNSIIADAVSDLSSNSTYSDFPHKEVGFLTNIGNARGDDIFSKKFDIRPENREITKETIFRGITEGDIKGPYISQFLWKDVPWGSQKLEQIQFHLNMYIYKW